jgi:hypothetical protein
MANTKSLDLEASSGQFAYITDANQTGLDITGDMTIMAWIKPESFPAIGADYILVSKYYNATGHTSFVLTLRGESASQVALLMGISANSNNVYFITVSAPTLTIGAWNHIAMVYNQGATSIEFFVNGVSLGVNTDSRMTSIANTDADFAIGVYQPATAPYDGLIDEVRIFNSTKNAAQILADYQRELAGNESNLQGYWDFDDSYNDKTSNHNNLSISGTPVFSSDVPFIDNTTTSTSTTSTSTTSTSSSTSTSTTSTSTSTTSTSTSKTTSTSRTTSTSTSRTTTSTSTTSTSSSTTSTSSSTSTSRTTSTSTTTTLDLSLIVEQTN